MAALTDVRLDEDLQASAPEIALALSRAGVTGVQKAVRIRRGNASTVMAAVIDCTVDLAADQKGVHMSRFPELFEEAIEIVVDREAMLVEVLAEHIASNVVERQGALRAEVWIRAQWPIHRRTPVTGLATQEMVTLCGIAAASESGTRRAVGVEATGINACPCAQGLVRNRASERLLEAGFDSGDVERILELVPIATHNQRGRQTLFVGTEQDLDAEVLVDVAERSMSAPIYDLLKRPDELFVVEHAHLQPRFVEDSVRHALRDALDTLPQLDDDDFLLSKQVNFETIHVHDVVAERFGTVGELRSELATGEPSPQQTTLAAWLSRLARVDAVQRPSRSGGRRSARDRTPRYVDSGLAQRKSNRCSVPAASRRMFWWCIAITAIAPAMPNSDDRPRVVEHDHEDTERDRGHDRRDRRKAREREDDEPASRRREPQRAARARTWRPRRSRPSCRPSGSAGTRGGHDRASPPRPRARRSALRRSRVRARPRRTPSPGRAARPGSRASRRRRGRRSTRRRCRFPST